MFEANMNKDKPGKLYAVTATAEFEYIIYVEQGKDANNVAAMHLAEAADEAYADWGNGYPRELRAGDALPWSFDRRSLVYHDGEDDLSVKDVEDAIKGAFERSGPTHKELEEAGQRRLL